MSIKDILLVDDNFIARMAIRKLIDKRSWQIDEASSGLDSLKRLREKNYDLIFLDLNMPDLDGVGVLEYLNEQNKMTNVIITTAMVNESNSEEVLGLGARAILTKPVEEEKLNLVIDSLEFEVS